MSGAAPTREVAYRLFADEFAQSTFNYAESDDDRAPQYLVAPTGARMNRVFVVGVLTETEEVSDGVLRARIVDPTGAFVCYAGQYQPDALAFFERAEPPTFVALTAKARTFEPEGSDRIFTSLRPEQVNEVTAGTRDSWVVETAEQTLERAALTAQALELPERGDRLRARLGDAGLEPGLAAGIPTAIAEYDVTSDYLAAVQQMALEAVEVVTGDRESVEHVAGEPAEAEGGEVMTEFASLTLSPPAAAASEAGIEDEESGSTPDEELESIESEAPTDSLESDAVENVGVPEADVDEKSAEGVDDGPTSGRMTETEPVGSKRDTAAQSETTDEAPNDASPTATRSAINETTDSSTDEEPGETETAVETDETAAADDAVETDVDAAEEDEDDLYELSAEERAEVEENFDVGFESGSEIGSPEETPDIEPEAGAGAEPDGETAVETAEGVDQALDDESPPDQPDGESSADDVSEETPTASRDEDDVPAEADEDEESVDGAETTAPAETTDEESAGGVDAPLDADEDPEDLVVETLQELGDGESVPRSELVATLEERYGLSEDAVADGIQAALLGGRCFESGADALKPI